MAKAASTPQRPGMLYSHASRPTITGGFFRDSNR